MPGLDNGLQLAAKGYGFLPDRRRAQARRTVLTRLMGMRAIALEGPDAARWFYDEDHVRRSGAIPEPVVGTLFGKGAVHSLDGEAHRVRKGLFVTVLMDADGIGSLVERVTSAWHDAVKGWARRRQIVLFDGAGGVPAGSVPRWAGVPVTDDEVPSLARDLTALVDGFATAGPRHWRARRARGRREAWLSQIVQQVRRGERTAPEGSALAAVAHHRDSDGQQLDPRVAAVEMLNVLRPTTAI